MPAVTDVGYHEVIQAVLNKLKSLSFSGISATDIRYERLPKSTTPRFGIIVSDLDEREAESTNETVDIIYPVLIGIYVHRPSSSDGLQVRDQWRKIIQNEFNYVRLGLDGELMTTCGHGDAVNTDQWKDLKVEASYMVVQTRIRKKHKGS